MAAKKYKHPTMLEAAHEMAKGLYEADIINATTMREFDTLCLAPVKDLTPTKKRRSAPCIASSMPALRLHGGEAAHCAIGMAFS